MPPCRLAASPYTWNHHQQEARGYRNGGVRAPARDLEGCTKNLSTDELRHGGNVLANTLYRRRRIVIRIDGEISGSEAKLIDQPDCF